MSFPLKAYIYLLIVFIGAKMGLALRFARLFFKRVFLSDKIERVFDGYEPNANDIIVATFAKSGTNMMLQMAIQTIYKGNASFNHIHELVPWPDTDLVVPAKLEDNKTYSFSPTGQRVIKTHLGAKDVPYDEQAKYICVLRNPCEVMVSSYHFIGGILGVCDHISLHDWVDLMIELSFVEMCAAHAAGFWEWRDRPNVLVWSYREAVKHPEQLISEVASLVDVDLDEESFDRVKRKASFSYMKAHESCFEPPANPFVAKNRRAKMVRAGKAGSAKQELLDRQVSEINRRAKAVLAACKSDFPYDTYY